MNPFTRSVAMLAIAGGVAAEPLPEIRVTADLRRDTMMATAGSVTVVAETVIQSRAAQHFEDVIHSIPNVNHAAGSNRARFFQIRGIGERSQFVNPVNPSVGLLIDDVDFSGAGAIATLADVKQVEVLRGPQGTRYGANALAGLINVVTNPPDGSRFASVRLSAGEYNTRTLGLVANAPLHDNLKARLVVDSHESDGYIRNDFLGRDDTNGRDELTARGRLAWQVRDHWSLGLSVARIDVDNGYDAFSLDNVRHTLSDEPGFDDQDSTYLALKSRWALARTDVELLLNRSDSDLGYGYDEDWTFTGIHPDGYRSTDHYLRRRETMSAEVRLLSGEAGRLFAGTTDWVAGLYYLESDERLQRQYTFLASDFFSDYGFDTIAAFMQLDAAIGPRLTLGAGLRLEERNTRYDDSDAVGFSPTDSLWGGRIALEYLAGDRAFLYGSVARGYKAGGFNVDGSLDADLRVFDGEYLIEYELGLKTTLADGRAGLQVAAFYNERNDQQVKSSVVRPRADGSTAFIDFLGNAAEGVNKGVEVNLDWRIDEHLRLTAGVGWLSTGFEDFINEFGEDLSGRDQAHAPGYTFSVSVDYARGPWFATLSADGKDEFYFSDRHSVKSNAYTLYHASFGYAGQGWKLTLWGRNLGDRDYFVRAFGSFGNDPRKSYITEPYFQFGEPRVSGVTVEFTLGER